MIKYLFSILMVVALSVSVASAEQGNGFTMFYYILHLQWSQGVLTEVEPHTLTTADLHPPRWGDWRIATKGTDGSIRSIAYFAPPDMDGAFDATLPQPGDGTQVVITDNHSDTVLRIDVSRSSICNGDGICREDLGESSDICPWECPVSAADTDAPLGTATITDSVSVRIGGAAMRVAYAGVGVLLLVAVAATLDIRRRV